MYLKPAANVLRVWKLYHDDGEPVMYHKSLQSIGKSSILISTADKHESNIDLVWKLMDSLKEKINDTNLTLDGDVRVNIDGSTYRIPVNNSKVYPPVRMN